MSTGTIAIDFDGVIHGYSKGWQDGSIYDPPITGAREALQALDDIGYEIIIYTTRAINRTVNGFLQRGQEDEVAAYLKRHDIVYDRIHTEPGKPLCRLFIDDNALRFEGDWPVTLAKARAILEKRQLADPRDERIRELEAGLRDYSMWLKRHLEHLEYRQTGTPEAPNGFAFSAVPEWDARQQLEQAEALLAAVPAGQEGGK